MLVDRLFGSAVCLLALAFLIFGIPTIGDDWERAAGSRYFTVGPHLFPYIAGGLCLLFGALIALRPQAGEPSTFLADAKSRRRVILLALLTIGYAAALDLLGFALAGMIAMALFMVGFGFRRWSVVLPVAVLLPWLTTLLFERLLHLQLPAGVLGLPFP